MVQDRSETVLLVSKAIGLSWPTVKAVLLVRAGTRGVPAHVLEQCLAVFKRLKRETAQEVLDFQRQRQQTRFAAPPG
jgi:hypothetical protein